MTAREILILARGYIEKGWCRGQFARTEDGEGALAVSEDARSWCALGAIERATFEVPMQSYASRGAAERLLREAAGVRSDFDATTAWNDDPERTKEEVLAAFDKAIELASQEEVRA